MNQNRVEIVPGKWTRFVENNNNNTDMSAPTGEDKKEDAAAAAENRYSPERSSQRSSENESEDSAGKPAARDAGSPVPILTTHTSSGGSGTYRSREQYHVYPPQFGAGHPESMRDPTFITTRSKKFVDYEPQDSVDG